MKGHLADFSQLGFKEGDRLRFAVHAETTDKLVLFASDGRFYTLGADRLPGGRGHGEPVRLMIDLEQSEDVIAFFVYQPGRKLLVASTAGNGFVVAQDAVVANTRKGKQILNIKAPDEAQVCRLIEDGADHVSAIGENRKLLIFPLKDLPEMTRGKGVRLQKYKDGGLSDACAFTMANGLNWRDSSDRTWTVTDLKDWLGARAQAGRLPPKGFPRSNRFD
jgi:topoisomerase-4 subunit A